MPPRSARSRRRASEANTDFASLDAANAAWHGGPDPEAEPHSAGPPGDAATPSKKATKAAGHKDARGGKKAPRDGSKKAALAGHDARIEALERTVADLAERLDALTRIVDEAVRASITPRPKATAVVPRNRPRKP